MLVDVSAGRVLWARNPESLRAPASLTKMVTAMVAVDTSPLDRSLTVTESALRVEPNLMGLKAGERLTVRELLYGLLLDSGNDAAEVLAGGLMSRELFVARMNDKAVSLGMSHTHFSNPSGLDQPGQYSDALDLAIAAGWLLTSYPDLATIVATKQTVLPSSPSHQAYSPYNLNLLLGRYPGANGVKTGFTDEAGGCIAAAARRGDRQLVAVVLGSDTFATDAQKLIDWGWTQAPG